MTDEEWKNQFDGRLRQVEERLTRIERDDAVANVHRANVEKRLDKIESSTTWLVRLILGAITMAVIGFIVQGGFNVP